MTVRIIGSVGRCCSRRILSTTTTSTRDTSLATTPRITALGDLEDTALKHTLWIDGLPCHNTIDRIQYHTTHSLRRAVPFTAGKRRELFVLFLLFSSYYHTTYRMTSVRYIDDAEISADDGSDPTALPPPSPPRWVSLLFLVDRSPDLTRSRYLQKEHFETLKKNLKADKLTLFCGTMEEYVLSTPPGA